MSRESLKGNAPVTIVTSVPWERERDITVIAVIAARSAKRRSVSDSDVTNIYYLNLLYLISLFFIWGSLFDPLTLALSIQILFNLISLLFKKNIDTFDPLPIAYLFSNC